MLSLTSGFSTSIKTMALISIDGIATQYRILEVEGRQYVPLEAVEDITNVSVLGEVVDIKTKTKYSTMQEVSKSVKSIARLYCNDYYIGSGIVIEPGIVVTCGHVTQHLKNLDINILDDIINSKRITEVEDVDLAFIKFSYNTQRSVKIGDVKNLKPGERVIYVGNMGHEFNMFSEGYVSGFYNKDGVNYIRTTVITYPGNSGGGIFNMDGEFLGLLTYGVEGKSSLALSVDEIIKRKPQVIK
jgi:S1-C subfamily serine protease